METLKYCGVTSIGACNHHCHVTEETIEEIFGPDMILGIKSYLGVPPCYAAKQTVLVQSLIEGSETLKMRIVGPSRDSDQVEIMKSDISKFKINPPIRESGDIEFSPGFRMIGPRGYVVRSKGLIISKPHLHLADEESRRLEIYEDDLVCVKTITNCWIKSIIVRVDKFHPTGWTTNRDINEIHIDKDDAVNMNLPMYSKAFIYIDSMDWLERRMI